VGKFIPVEPEKWAEMVKAQAEVARLEALTAEMDKTINASQAECRRLKAEVERVGAENSHLHKGIYSLSLNVGQLKDEVERLTKAGDAMMADLIGEFGSYNSVDEWNAAKEVQS
jgi:uncharacterized small protein (DUF1192 family)